MKLTYTEILKSLVLGATIAFAFSGTVVHAQTVLFSSYGTASVNPTTSAAAAYNPASPNANIPPTGGNLTPVNNYDGNGDWSTDTFELSTSVTDPTIVFFTDTAIGTPPVLDISYSANLVSAGSAPTTTLVTPTQTAPIVTSTKTNLTYNGNNIYANEFTYNGAFVANEEYYLQLSNAAPVADDIYWFELPTGDNSTFYSDVTDAYYGNTPAHTFTGRGAAADAFQILAAPEPSAVLAILIGVVGLGVLLLRARQTSAANLS